ncbi:DNA polymerase alpha subunit B [Physocladia obscura]|uniref:DNA polymerase alpha subunit B n=1 Tax=Physocladia obscura TaxID=109957 RepID=A0AAD5T262_9FUNG|nr:DNA polymerase alpha subunit B [Physocladia obscura]
MLSANKRNGGGQIYNSSENNSELKSQLILEFRSTLDLTQSVKAEMLDRLSEWCCVFGVTAEAIAAKYEAIAANNAANSLSEEPEYILDTLRMRLQSEFDIALQAKTLGQSSFLSIANTASQPFSQQHTQKIFNTDDVMNFVGSAGFNAKAKLRGANSQHAKTMSSGNMTSAASALQRAPIAVPKEYTLTNTSTLTLAPKIQSQTLSHPTVAFKDRPNKGKVEDVFNSHVPLKLNSLNGLRTLNNVEISLPPGQQMDGYRYMFDRLTEKGDLVDSRIQELSLTIDSWIHQNIILKEAALEGDTMDEDVIAVAKRDDDKTPNFRALANPAIPHHTRFYTAGRIVASQSPSDLTSLQSSNSTTQKKVAAVADKLNADNLMLETCRALGGGTRVSIALSDAAVSSGVAFFPGMVVGLSGVNPSGNLVHVDRVYEAPKLGFPTSRIDEILRMYDVGKNGNVNVIVAAGPFSVDGNGLEADYEPLREVVAVVEREAPQVVILCGPFVDEATYAPGKPGYRYAMRTEDVFRKMVAPLIKKMAEVEGTRVIIAPSTRGMESAWVAYPQPPIGSNVSSGVGGDVLRGLGLRELVASGKVILVPNPVQLSINEVLISLSNVDSLMHLSGEEFVRLPATSSTPNTMQSSDKFVRLFKHHLSQRHLYPLSPPPISDLYFALDVTRAYGGAASLQAMPDILILPSMLRACVRNVEGCVCVNPGMVVKGVSGGGNFARICVHPLEVERMKEQIGGIDSGIENGGGGISGKRKAEETDDAVNVTPVASAISDHSLEHSVHSRCRVEIQRI